MAWTLNLLPLAGIVAVCLWAAQPVGVGEATNSGAETFGIRDSSDVHTPQVRGRDAYAIIHSRHYDKPLYDSKPVVAEKKPPPKPKLNAKLVGTALDPGFTYGFFRDSHGQTKMIGVGQTIEGAKVLEIKRESAVVEFHGDTLTLIVEKEG